MNSLQPLVAPVLDPLVGQKCTEIILSLDFKDLVCHKLLISKGLSFGIVLGSVLVKLPQILKIVSAKSTKGISMSGYLLETFAILVTLFYNLRLGNPFSTYGETFFLVIQNLIIIGLFFIYKSKILTLVLNTLVWAGLAFALYTPEIVSQSVLVQLQVSTIALGILSKLPQIYTNFANQSTGQLSIITAFLQFAGSFARVFTTLQEIEDVIILASAISAAALNGIIFAQILIFGNKKSKKE
ncbi:hypothetical protein EDD86DRAFT_210086 [Gorgonomyces haynaldii]|nr:hypothetical protein EDD86DRAFT_210086 [Gorgonomyces haynaldii]